MLAVSNAVQADNIVHLAISAYGFHLWTGGQDFLMQLARAIAEIDDDRIEKISILVPSNDFAFRAKSALGALLSSLSSMVGLPIVSSSVDLKPLFQQIDALPAGIHRIYGPSGRGSEFKLASLSGVDVLIPCFSIPPSDFALPVVGYLPDVQHRHMLEYFSEREAMARDRKFGEMCSGQRHVVVNSLDTKRDLERYFCANPGRVHALPFSPCPKESWFQEERMVRERYGITMPYFIICNQFWRHKEHLTAISAFGELSRAHPDLQLVCTGSSVDYRDSGYFDSVRNHIKELGLRDRVFLLGQIPKIDQLALLREARAVIQPSMFEGGPGGGAGAEAVAMDRPLILSNIEVNREIDHFDCTAYFEAGNHASLAQVMSKFVTGDYVSKSKDKLIEEGEARLRALGRSLIDVAIRARATE